MEVTPPIHDVRGHADSLLASLNLQRDLAQFCDCVIRQSSAHLFLAHRCVLAASSPVLASLLASNGTLLELQAPCLSDSVLSLVLDYIYTGDLPPPTAQQQYCSLLTAASYLQMDQLKQDLKARQRTNTDDGDNSLTTASTTATHCSKIMKDQPFSEDVYSKHTAVEIYTTLCENSMEKQDHPFSAKTYDLTHDLISSAKVSSCLAFNGNDCSSGSNILANATGTSDLEEVLRQEENSCELHSPGTDEPEEVLRTVGELGLGRRQCSRAREAFQASSPFLNGHSVHHRGGERSPTSTSFSPLSCSAVPVICHSGKATVLQPAETATLPHLYPGSQSSSGAGVPSSPPVPPQPASPKEGTHSNASANYVGIGAGFKEVNLLLAQNPHHGGNEDKDPFGIQNWNYKPTAVMTLDYKGKAHFGVQHKEKDFTVHGLSQRTDVKDHLVHCGSIQCDNDTKRPSDDELTQNEDYKDFPNAEDYKHSDDDEKHPPVGYFVVSMMSAEAEPTGDCRSLTVVGSNIGSEYQHGDHCFGGREEAEEDCRGDGRSHRTDRMDHAACQNRTLTRGRDGDQPERESHTALAGDTAYDPAYSHSRHVQYHCLPREYAQQTHTHPGRHTHPPPDHPNLSGEWGGVGTRSSLNRSPLTQHCSRGAENHLLLLDISTAPAQFLVSRGAGAGEGRGEPETGDGAGGVERGLRERPRGTDGYGDGSAEPVHHQAGPCSDDSSTDSSADTNNGEERGLSTCLSASVPPDLSVYASAPVPPPALLVSPPQTLLQHPYHCTLCDRSFSQRGSLNRHMRSHLGVRPYPCPRCPMTFSRQYRVTEHMRVHQRCGPDQELQKPLAPPT